MRYELTNLGPGAFYCVEVAKLLKAGASVGLNFIDEGTQRLAEGPKPRLKIVDTRVHPLTLPPRPADAVTEVRETSAQVKTVVASESESPSPPVNKSSPAAPAPPVVSPKTPVAPTTPPSQGPTA